MRNQVPCGRVLSCHFEFVGDSEKFDKGKSCYAKLNILRTSYFDLTVLQHRDITSDIAGKSLAVVLRSQYIRHKSLASLGY